MYIKYLNLLNFRNYDELSIELNKNINIIIGDNAQGKTNILESIYYCSIGKSHRTNKDKELIQWNKEQAYIRAYVSKERIDKKIEIKLLKEGKKAININTIKINKISELMGNLNVVMFSPEDLKIIKDSPSFRRKFLDIELCKINSNYYYNLVQYNKVLEERNALIKRYYDSNSKIIDVYDEQLSNYGSYIIKCREDYIDKLNQKGKIIHNDITSNTENINFKYITSIKNTKDAKEEIKNLLLKNRKNDFERRITSIGPHRDDIYIDINGIDVRCYGSQGQQRTSILTIKFASVEIIKELIGEYPVLLLDDVLSELDEKRQKYILSSIINIQTVITGTGIQNIMKYISGNTKVFNIVSGKISSEEVISCCEEE